MQSDEHTGYQIKDHARRPAIQGQGRRLSVWRNQPVRLHGHHVVLPVRQAPPTLTTHDAQVAGQGAECLRSRVREIASTDIANTSGE